MARPTRLELSGATYLVTTHGSEGGVVFHNEGDREDFLTIYQQVSRRLGWQLHFYHLADHYYQLLVATPKGDLSRGMRQLNGVYTQHFNRKHASTGALFQGRFKALIVDTREYYQPVLRYLVGEARKSSRGRKADRPTHSGVKALLKPESAPTWLAVSEVLGYFARSQTKAIARLSAYLNETSTFDPKEHVRHQIYLGDAGFVAELRKRAARADSGGKTAPKGGIKAFLKAARDPKQGMAKAYLSGQFRMQEIAQAFGVHYSTVSRAVKAYEEKQA